MTTPNSDDAILKEMLQVDGDCKGIKGGFWNWEYHEREHLLPPDFTSEVALRNWFECHNIQMIDAVKKAISLTRDAERKRILEIIDSRIQDKVKQSKSTLDLINIKEEISKWHIS